jgi:hypothetical protein
MSSNLRLDAQDLQEEGIELGGLQSPDIRRSFPIDITGIIDDTLISIHHGRRRAHHHHHGELAHL